MTILVAHRVARTRDRALVALYRTSRGRILRTSRGIPLLLLTTISRRTGLRRTHPVGICRDDGTRLIVAGTNRGVDRSPAWVANLRSEPWARIEIGAAITDVLVRSTTSGEQEKLWRSMCERHPAYSSCSARSDRDFPVLVLEPIR